MQPYPSLPHLFFAHNAQELTTEGKWFLNFEYRAERERGLDFEEDLFHPFTLRFDLTKRRGATVIASTESHVAESAAVLRESERRRREAIVDAAPGDQPLVTSLAAAADQFIVQRGALKTIVAGYHWFTDWGRDTMIALPGLTLVTGRYDIARQILPGSLFRRRLDQGLLPNRFPDAGEDARYTQYCRRNIVVHRGHSGLSPLQRRRSLCAGALVSYGLEKHHRLASSRLARLRNSRRQRGRSC